MFISIYIYISFVSVPTLVGLPSWEFNHELVWFPFHLRTSDKNLHCDKKAFSSPTIGYSNP